MQDVHDYQERYHRDDFQEPAKPDKSRAYAVKRDRQLQTLQKRIGRDWLKCGQIILEFHDDELWREIGFDSFPAWVETRTAHSIDYAYKAMRVVDQLKDVAPEKLDRMTMANAATVAKLPQEKRTAEVIDMACTMENKALEEELDRRHPGVIDPDGTQVWSCRVPKSLVQVIERAIEMAKEVEHTDSKAVALEAICSNYVTTIVDNNRKAGAV